MLRCSKPILLFIQ